ncbi:hypothetical protein [Aeromicrobium terrae]|uniref:DoxX family protein n=1 Tax=Aeromicrobium terrae TaxID=2498846 RepID=A0A5C8NLN0_9ACTN|nr:hypothetical protein [Aeromicrobium terrae]TXL61383.1 hypothetical protein FHP06_08110 [Aeromicrobium terrae]
MTRTRLAFLRGGYLFMGLGLALVKWPDLADAADLPVYEGVTLSLLTAMSVLALLGALRPVALLPVLVLETLWKLIWLALVALPLAIDGDLDGQAAEIAVNCSLVVVIIAVVPWRYVWRQMSTAEVSR